MTSGGRRLGNANKLVEDGAFGGKDSEAPRGGGHRRHGSRSPIRTLPAR
jgi:hypothetical protein